MGTVSLVIITKNEAPRIRRCLESVSWASEIVVVDAGSTDGTQRICREYAAKVLERPFDTFDRQRNFALEAARGQWILFVDADEVVSASLRAEICSVLAKDGNGHDGFLLRRMNYLCGQPIVHAWGRDALVRLIRRGHGRFQGAVHEKLQVDGTVGELQEPLYHFNSDTLKEYVTKNLRYVQLEAERRLHQGDRFGLLRALVSPLRVFLFRYVRLQGFRDGIMGLILCVFLAFFTFLLHARLWALSRPETSP